MRVVLAVASVLVLFTICSCASRNKALQHSDQIAAIKLAREVVAHANRYNCQRLADLEWKQSSARHVMKHVKSPERHYRSAFPFWPSLQLAAHTEGKVDVVRVYLVPSDSETAKYLFSWCVGPDSKKTQELGMSGKLGKPLVLIPLNDSRGPSCLPLVLDSPNCWKALSDPGEWRKDDVIGLSDLPWIDVKIP